MRLAWVLLIVACSKPVVTVATPDAGPPLPSLLEQCTSAVTPDGGEPDWATVEAICGRGTNKHAAEAIEWVGKARREEVAKQLLVFGERLHAQGKDDDAIKELSKIPPQSYTYPRALPLLKQLVDANLAHTKAECIDALAQPRHELLSCEQYFLARCFVVASSELQPPPGKRLVLEGKLGRDGWRPSDALLVDFLIAYQKQHPAGPAWECAGSSMGPRVCSLAPEAFRAELTGDDSEALLAYCGQGPDGVEAWRYARPELFAQVQQVRHRLDEGNTALRSAKLKPALDAYGAALELDTKLLRRANGKGARGWVEVTTEQAITAGVKTCDGIDQVLAWVSDEWMKQAVTRRREALQCKPQ